MNKLRINMLATRKTNRILEKYGTAEGYNLDNVHTEPLYEALKAFYTENENGIGHTITHNAGILYIDNKAIVRFATPNDTLNRRLAKASGNYYDAEYRILKRQEESMI